MAEAEDFTPPWLTDKPAAMLPEDWSRLTQAYWQYTNTYYRHTEITKHFLAPANVVFVVQMINKSLREITGEPTFECKEFYTGDLQLSMAEVAYGNSSYANTGKPEDFGTAVDVLTGKFIDMWITDLWIGWREKQRYQQWMLEDNRLKQFPYPEIEPHNHASTAWDIGDYKLSSPWSVGYQDFLDRYRHPCTKMPQISECPNKTSVQYFFNQVFQERCSGSN